MDLHHLRLGTRMGLRSEKGLLMTAANDVTSATTQAGTEAGYANKVTKIVDTIGKSLAAFTLDTNPSTVGRWAAGANAPKNLRVERRIENLHRVLVFLLNEDQQGRERSRHEVRAWLMGINAHLDDVSPAEAIKAGDYREVMAAARAYATGG